MRLYKILEVKEDAQLCVSTKSWKSKKTHNCCVSTKSWKSKKTHDCAALQNFGGQRRRTIVRLYKVLEVVETHDCASPEKTRGYGNALLCVVK